jgi:hypothetical protein
VSSSFGNNLIKKDAPPKGSKVTHPEDEENRGYLIQFVWSSGEGRKPGSTDIGTLSQIFFL